MRGFFRLERAAGNSSLTLTDTSGHVPINPIHVKGVDYPIGNIVWVSGMASQHASSLSVRLLAMVPAIRWTGNPFALVKPHSPGYFVADRLCRHVQSITDSDLSRLISHLFSDPSIQNGFMSAPASIRHHHAYPGGLAVHTCEVMDIASQIAGTLNKQEYSLVMTACLLHDAGKVLEYAKGGRRLSSRGEMLGYEITLLEMLAPIADRIWSRGHPKRLMLFHLLTAKPAPQWTGIRHPRSRLVSIVRFADRWSSAESRHNASSPHMPYHPIELSGVSRGGTSLKSVKR